MTITSSSASRAPRRVDDERAVQALGDVLGQRPDVAVVEVQPERAGRRTRRRCVRRADLAGAEAGHAVHVRGWMPWKWIVCGCADPLVNVIRRRSPSPRRPLHPRHPGGSGLRHPRREQRHPGEGRGGAPRPGLDRPVPVQYAEWIGAVARGDLGKSLISGRPIGAIWRCGCRDARASSRSTLLSVLVGVPLGVVAATNRNFLPDLAVST